jgi:hypothetical protein
MAVMAPFFDGAEREVDEALIAAIIAAAEARTTQALASAQQPG